MPAAARLYLRCSKTLARTRPKPETGTAAVFHTRQGLIRQTFPPAKHDFLYPAADSKLLISNASRNNPAGKTGKVFINDRFKGFSRRSKKRGWTVPLPGETRPPGMKNGSSASGFPECDSTRGEPPNRPGRSFPFPTRGKPLLPAKSLEKPPLATSLGRL